MLATYHTLTTMKLDGSYIEDRLQLAEQEEIATSESQLFGDLREHLTPERITEGVSIEFSELAAFKSVVDALGIFELLAKQPESLHVHALHLYGDRGVNRLGKLTPSIAELPFLTTLSLLQAGEWETYGSYPAIQTQTEAMSSRILIANSKRMDDGTLEADLDTIGAFVGMYNRYLPDFDDPELSLPYALRTLEEGHGSRSRETTAALMRYAAVERLDIVMPRASYSLGLGMLEAGDEVFAPIDQIRIRHHLAVIAGRVMIKPEELEDSSELEDQPDTLLGLIEGREEDDFVDYDGDFDGEDDEFPGPPFEL